MLCPFDKEISVLDATAIGISIFRKDINTAGSVMFLLGIGELLEEWTRKKSIDKEGAVIGWRAPFNKEAFPRR
ncbi:hypothetical protein [Clostridioides difficile]|uniref:hypothetical protein n=1 Tax=Clostridioides difficile TaxID=1496 RepID=UPI0028AAF0E4|nr:hypothetical protein [Clostridioides difficile]